MKNLFGYSNNRTLRPITDRVECIEGRYTIIQPGIEYGFDIKTGRILEPITGTMQYMGGRYTIMQPGIEYGFDTKIGRVLGPTIPTRTNTSTKTQDKKAIEQRKLAAIKHNNLLFLAEYGRPEPRNPDSSKVFELVQLDDFQNITPLEKKKLRDSIENAKQTLIHFENSLKPLKEKIYQLAYYFEKCQKECAKPMTTGFLNFLYYEINGAWHSHLVEETCELKLNKVMRSLRVLVSEVNDLLFKIEQSLLMDLKVGVLCLQNQISSILEVQNVRAIEAEDLYAKQKFLLDSLSDAKRILTNLCSPLESTVNDNKVSLSLEFRDVAEVRTVRVGLRSGG